MVTWLGDPWMTVLTGKSPSLKDTTVLVVFHVKCLLLSDLNENWKMVENFSEISKYKI
jgi:hypothetical protein